MRRFYKNPNFIAYLICIPFILTIGVTIYGFITKIHPNAASINIIALLSPLIMLVAYKSSNFNSIIKYYTIIAIFCSIPHLYFAFTGSIVDKLYTLIYTLTIYITYIVIDYLNLKRISTN